MSDALIMDVYYYHSFGGGGVGRLTLCMTLSILEEEANTPQLSIKLPQTSHMHAMSGLSHKPQASCLLLKSTMHVRIVLEYCISMLTNICQTDSHCTPLREHQI